MVLCSLVNNRKMLNSKLRLKNGIWKRNWEVTGYRIQVAGLSCQCSNHWVTATHDSQLCHIPVLFGGTGIQQSHTQQPSVCAVRTPYSDFSVSFHIPFFSLSLEFNIFPQSKLLLHIHVLTKFEPSWTLEVDAGFLIEIFRRGGRSIKRHALNLTDVHVHVCT